MYDNIKVTLEAGVATVTLNRPEKLNAFAGHMRRDLAEALEQAASDKAVRVVVVTGAGRGFCAGADVKFMQELMERDDVEEFRRLLGAGRRVLTSIRQMTKPVIASVNGPAYGAGFNLALACDLRLAAESASFSQSFVKVGLHPDWGGTYFLPRVVSDSELEAETRRLAERLRDAPRASVAAAKQAVYMSEGESLERMIQYETEAQVQCFESPEARRRVRAFLERKKSSTAS